MKSSPFREPTDLPSAPEPVVRLFLLIILTAAALYVPLPDRAPRGIAETEFSASRALDDVADLANAPHPVGSPEHDRVRDRLFQRIRRIGLEPQILAAEATVTRRERRTVRLENIVARLGGRDSSSAVLLLSHYDSAPAAPGAGDDGASVAAMLETMRALTAGPVLAHDVVFMFTDGEELGLLGAAAGVQAQKSKPEAATTRPEHAAHALDGVRVVLNFEARGSSGPSWMFETSPQNGALVRLFAESVPLPMGSSLMGDAYRRMPNDTDFTVMRRAGFAGLNFAFIGDYENYHRPTDDLEHLDADTLQHHGEQMLALARRLADMDLRTWSPTGEGDRVYFNPWPGRFVHYPARWAPILAAVTLALAALRIGRRRATGEFFLGGAARSAAWTLAVLLGVTVLAFLAAQGILRITRIQAYFPWGLTGADGAFIGAIVALATALFLVAFGRIAHRHGDLAVETALVGFFATGLALTAFWVPGASYVFQWPLLWAIGCGFLRDWAAVRTKPYIETISACSIVGVVALIPPLVQVIGEGMMLGMAAVAIPVLGLGLGLSWAFFAPIARLVAWLSGVVGLVLLAVGFITAS